LHAISNTGVHGGAARQNGVGIEVLSDVNVTLHDGVVSGFVDAAGLHAKERGLEQSLRTPESFVADGNDLTVGELVRLLERRGRRGGGHLLLKVQGNVAKLFLDVADNLALGRGCERVPSLRENFHEVVGEVSPGQVKTEDGVGQSIT